MDLPHFRTTSLVTLPIDISPTARLALQYLIAHDVEGGITVSLATIATAIGASRRNIAITMHSLVAAGYVTRTRDNGPASKYTFTLTDKARALITH